MDKNKSNKAGKAFNLAKTVQDWMLDPLLMFYMATGKSVGAMTASECRGKWMKIPAAWRYEVALIYGRMLADSHRSDGVKTDIIDEWKKYEEARGRFVGVIKISLTLEKIKRYPKLKRHLAGQPVVIWSGEHMAWWRPDVAGYTIIMSEAGVYKFEDALARSEHCDKSKRISYRLASSLIDRIRETKPKTLGDWVKNY